MSLIIPFAFSSIDKKLYSPADAMKFDKDGEKKLGLNINEPEFEKIDDRVFAQLLIDFEVEINQKYGSDTVYLNISHSYENMLSVIENNMYTIGLAKEAIKSVGLEPLSRPVRGGTDGARLSFMGLPCPNLGTGGYGFHGPFEHIIVEGMETAVKIIKYIAEHSI